MKMLRTLIVICAKMLFIHISFKERQLLLMYEISQGEKIQFINRLFHQSIYVFERKINFYL